MRKLPSGFARVAWKHRPTMETLETRLQPGSLLSTSALFAMPISEIVGDEAIAADSRLLSIKRIAAITENSTGTANGVFAPARLIPDALKADANERPAYDDRDSPFSRPSLRDDDRSVHTLGIIPGSSIKFKDLFETFGDDPPTAVLQNVNILPNDAMIVNNADLPLIQVSAVVSGFNVTGTVIWLSNLRGTYDDATGKMTAKARFQLHVTSDAPGFNNSNCKVPPVGVNMSTDKPGAAPFFNGEGTIVDNTAVVNAVPDSACGSFIFVDYSDEVNNYLNLPSLNSGDNILTLRLRMTPSLPPP